MKELASQILSIWKTATLKMKVIYGIALMALAFFLYTSSQVNTTHKVEINSIKENEPSGLDLFTVSSWVRSDKELKMLELRALKSQLELDLAKFESVENATVLIDLSEDEEKKASVILKLKPDMTMTVSLLVAISSHVACSLHGLERENISISDVKGSVYKINGNIQEALFEQEIEEKLQKGLKAILGVDNFYLSTKFNAEKKDLYITLFQKDLKNTEEIIIALLKGYDLQHHIEIRPISFAAALETHAPKKALPYFLKLLLFSLSVLLFVSLFLFAFTYFKKKKPKVEENDELYEMMKGVNISTLSSLIKDQTPQTIALMISYLEEEKGETLLSELPRNLKEEVMIHLSRLKKV